MDPIERLLTALNELLARSNTPLYFPQLETLLRKASWSEADMQLLNYLAVDIKILADQRGLIDVAMSKGA